MKEFSGLDFELIIFGLIASAFPINNSKSAWLWFACFKGL